MIIDDITDCLIQRTLDDGGEVWAFNASDKFKVISAGNNQVTIESQGYKFGVGDKLSFLYLPKYSTPYCNPYKDTDGDGIIDLVDLDKDGDGVIDPRAPFRPTFVYVLEILPTIAPSQVTIAISPNPVLVTKAREWGKPLVIDGYYPLYISEGEALWASPLAEPLAHPHEMSEEHDGVNYRWEYWMPHGVNQWHGNYTNCPPHDLFEVFATSVETYDFEYVDRVAGRSFFASIIPYDYTNRILGIDRDENGTYESTQSYFLENMYNSQDILNESGELVTNGDFKWSHYSTNPRQAWTFEVTSKASSEDTLPDGHSFQMGNYVYHIRTYSKFSPDTEDARKHTLSWAIYHSKLTNGSNAEFSAQSGGVVVYNQSNGNGGDYWAKKAPLEINSDGFIVMDDDMFSEGDRFYIIEQYVPEAPSIVVAEGPTLPDAIAFVTAQLYIVKPRGLLIVNASVLEIPTPPTVSANIYVVEQEIVWDQFETGSTTGERPLEEIIEVDEKATELPVNRVLGDPAYDLELAGAHRFIKVDPFKTISQAPMTYAHPDNNYQAWKDAQITEFREGSIAPRGMHLPVYHTMEQYLAETVVTQGLFKSVMGSHWKPFYNARDEGDNLPAHNIGYYHAQQFVAKLNEIQVNRGNLPKGWAYAFPSPLVLNRYLGHDFAGTSYYMDIISGSDDAPSKAGRMVKEWSIDNWEGADNVLPLQEITEEARSDVFNSVLHAPWGSSHVNVKDGYKNRYGFINPYGTVETFTQMINDMRMLTSSTYTAFREQNNILSRYNYAMWTDSEHPYRVADYNWKFNFGGMHPFADGSDYNTLGTQLDPIGDTGDYIGTWGMARNAMVRAVTDDPVYGEAIYNKSTFLRVNVDDNNRHLNKQVDGVWRHYRPSMTYWSSFQNISSLNMYYFPNNYDIPQDFNGTNSDVVDNHFSSIRFSQNVMHKTTNLTKNRPEAGLRLCLINFNSGYVYDTTGQPKFSDKSYYKSLRKYTDNAI